MAVGTKKVRIIGNAIVRGEPYAPGSEPRLPIRAALALIERGAAIDLDGIPSEPVAEVEEQAEEETGVGEEEPDGIVKRSFKRIGRSKKR